MSQILRRPCHVSLYLCISCPASLLFCPSFVVCFSVQCLKRSDGVSQKMSFSVDHLSVCFYEKTRVIYRSETLMPQSTVSTLHVEYLHSSSQNSETLFSLHQLGCTRVCVYIGHALWAAAVEVVILFYYSWTIVRPLAIWGT